MRYYDLDKTQPLKQTGSFRVGLLKALAWAFRTQWRVRGLGLALLGLGLVLGGLALFLLNQNPAQAPSKQHSISSVPQLGVLYISSHVAFRNLPGSPAAQGLVITEVKPGSSASQAGLLTGDVLTHLDGKVIQADDSLLALLKDYEVGDRLNLGVYRNDHALNITVVLT